MIEAIRESMRAAPDLTVARLALVDVFRKIKQAPDTRISFVSGTVTSDGYQHIDRNLQALSVYTHMIRTSGTFGPFVISAAEVFNKPLIAKFHNVGAENHHFLAFWRDILRSRLIDFVFMTPGWERSQGATEEFTTAKLLHLNILSINEGGIITPIMINKASIMPARLNA